MYSNSGYGWGYRNVRVNTVNFVDDTTSLLNCGPLSQLSEISTHITGRYHIYDV